MKTLRKLKAAVLAASFLALALFPSLALAVDGPRPPIVVKFGAFDAADTTDTVTLYTTSHFEYIRGVVMCLNTVFAGGSIASYTISVGKAGAVEKYATATDVFTGASVTTAGAANCTVFTGPGVERAGTAIIATATASHNVSTATTGQVTFYILTGNMPAGG